MDKLPNTIKHCQLPENCLCGGKINPAENDYVRHQVHELPVLKLHETGHNRDGKNQWMWGFISPAAAHFSIHSSRGKKVLL